LLLSPGNGDYQQQLARARQAAAPVPHAPLR
jgi:hypothetical protein